MTAYSWSKVIQEAIDKGIIDRIERVKLNQTNVWVKRPFGNISPQEQHALLLAVWDAQYEGKEAEIGVVQAKGCDARTAMKHTYGVNVIATERGVGANGMFLEYGPIMNKSTWKARRTRAQPYYVKSGVPQEKWTQG